MTATLDQYLTQARSQLGYREISGGRTKYGVWWGTPDMDWCAAFLIWCAHQVGDDLLIPRRTFTVEMARAFQADDRLTTTPRVGACVFFDWSGGDAVAGIDHVALVEAVHSDGTITTIGGNESDAVLRRRRTTRYVVGYGHPRYRTPIHPRTLRLGDTGDTVTLLQRLLAAELGIRLQVDGIYGPETLEAVRMLQRKARITPDGIVGPLTWTALGR